MDDANEKAVKIKRVRPYVATGMRPVRFSIEHHAELKAYAAKRHITIEQAALEGWLLLKNHDGATVQRLPEGVIEKLELLGQAIKLWGNMTASIIDGIIKELKG